MLIDTHAHLYWESFEEDFDEMIQRSLDATVSTIINVGVDVEKSQVALRQAQGKLADIPNLSVYSTIGIHPHEALRLAQGKPSLAQAFGSEAQARRGKPSDVDVSIQKDMDKLEQIYKNYPERVVGVGECGLDFLFDPSFAEASEGKPINVSQIKILQKKLFQAQINLAKKLKLPLIVHCRDNRSQDPQNSEAWDEILKMVGTHPTILHCYSGLPHTTLRLVRQDSPQVRSGQANLLVSFAANITYPKNEYLREAVKLIPLDRIVLETDSPFLAPQSKRGQRNEPANVTEIAQLIAEIKGLSFEEVAQKTTQNAKKVFNI